MIEDVDMNCWSLFEAYAEVGQFGYTKEKISAFWYKDPTSEWLENDLKLFEGDRDAIEMCKIAGKRGHVDLYVVHKVEVDEEFSEVGFLDVGGPDEHVQEAGRANDEEVHNEKQLVIYQGDGGQEVEKANAEAVKEGDKLNPDEQVKSNSDEDSDDEDFIPSDGEVDNADDVMFTDSEEEYDDESGFDEVKGGTDGDRVEKGKGVAGGDFSDEEGFNSDDVDVDYEVGGGSEKEDSEDDDNNEAIRYPIHKDVKYMTRYKWEVGTVFASREEFKDTVTAYAVQTRRGLRYVKLDLARERAVCQEGCPFWLYAAKMSEEETWQLRSVILKHTCGQSHRVGILHTGWLSKAFRKKVEGNLKVKIKDLVNKAQRKWNLTVTTSMAARSRQAALDEIQGAYQK
nr:protein bfr2-like [Arachis hypogaea]